MHNPKAATVAMAAERLPRRPSQGLLRTQSVIMHVTTENRPIMINVLAKYGTIVFVLASSSSSRVLEANLAVLMCLNTPSSSALPTTSRKASSQAAPLIRQIENRWDYTMSTEECTEDCETLNHEEILGKYVNFTESWDFVSSLISWTTKFKMYPKQI